MRIALLTTSLTGGGAEFVAATWADWLAAEGHDVTVIATGTTTAAPTGPRVRVRRLAVQHTPGRVRAVRAALRREPVDALVSLQSYPNLIALAATAGLRRRPVVLVSERNITTREGEPRSLAEALKRALARRAYRRADTVVAISHAVAAELVSAYGIRPERLVVVPNPAGRRAELRPDPAPRTDRISLAEPLHLLLPMRLVAQKRADVAIEAAARLRADGVDARVVCFGRGPLADDLSAAAARWDVPLTMAGWSADWVAAAPPNAVTVLPSYREGFGNVLVESAMGGIPSVAVSTAYGVADALVPTVTGQLAFTGDAADLAAAVRAVERVAPGPAAAWARRFSSDHSGALLLRAIDRARTARSERTAVTVLASAVGQYDNVGDTVLRRGYLDHLRSLGPLTVYVGDKSDDYVSGLGLQPEDRAVRDARSWRRTVSRQLLAGRGVYAFDTGETEVRRPFALRYLRLAPLLLAHRLRGGTAVLTGVGVRESHPWRRPIAAVLRLCRVVSWRDEASRRLMGLGEVTPDWAFALGADADVLRDASASRPLLAISVRQGLRHAARERPDDAWVATVRELASALGLEPIVVAQIERDGDLARDLAARLHCDAVVWLDDDHARQEARLRETYRRSAAVLSDRLHAVVIAATEGAVPVALSAGPMDKTTRTLAGAGIADTSVSRDLSDPDAALTVLRSALARRGEIVEAVIDARARLSALTERIAAEVTR